MLEVKATQLVVALAFAVSADLLGQERGRQAFPESRLDSIVRRVESMTPRSGAPGTPVTLRTGGMPALTPLRIGVGAVRFGFEEVGQVLTNERGEFSLEVIVPAWARRDLAHRFIVFDFYFVPIALTDVFHATDADGVLSRTGELVTEGPPCAVLRGEDSLLYALIGDLTGFTTRNRILVEGRIAESSPCSERTTIAVTRIIARDR